MGCNFYLAPLIFLIAFGIIEIGLVAANFESSTDFREIDYPKGNIDLLRPATIMIIVSAVWNGTLGIVYCILTAGNGVSIFTELIPSIVIFVWGLLAATLWCASGILYYLAHGPVKCSGFTGPVNCEITIAVEAVGWVNFVLTLLLVGLAVRWINKSVKARKEPQDDNTKFVNMERLIG